MTPKEDDELRAELVCVSDVRRLLACHTFGVGKVENRDVSPTYVEYPRST